MEQKNDQNQLEFPGTWAKNEPERIAIVMTGSGEEMTYFELDEKANRIANLFVSLGLNAGDHAAFCLENTIDFLPLAWGAHYAGLYYTAISSRLTDEEMSYIVKDCGARVFITSVGVRDTAEQMNFSDTAVQEKFSIGGELTGYTSLEDAIESVSKEPRLGRVEGQDMLYSSGTTGLPKGVKVKAPDVPLGSPSPQAILFRAVFGIESDAVYLSPAPLYHAAPLRFCMAAHRIGATVVVMEKFDPEGALAAIEANGVTASQWVPTMFVRMLKLPEEVREKYNTTSLKTVIHAAAPCPIEVKKQMIDWWGPILHEYYAGTEGNGFTYINSEDWLSHQGSVGKSLLGELVIVDDEGNEIPVGEEGNVYFRSDSRFEYHNDPEKTASSRIGEDLSTLGDIGRVDEDGFLYLTDRKAHMIISGGVNIYPQEAENILTMHPDVYDVAVIGVPNDEFGEEVKAVVQLIDPKKAGQDLAKELIAYCRSHLADLKCPRSVDFREELPRHPTGKLYKRLLKDQYWGERKTRI